MSIDTLLYNIVNFFDAIMSILYTYIYVLLYRTINLLNNIQLEKEQYYIDDFYRLKLYIYLTYKIFIVLTQ